MAEGRTPFTLRLSITPDRILLDPEAVLKTTQAALAGTDPWAAPPAQVRAECGSARRSQSCRFVANTGLEGTDVPGGGVWERVTYEWTDAVVKSASTAGNLFQTGGTFEFRVEPQGSGSRIRSSLDRKAKTVIARLVGVFMQVSTGAPMKRSFYTVYGKPS